jgi:hypothetical protein
MFKPLKQKFHLNYTQEFYLEENTTHLHYKKQEVNGV